MAEVRFRVITRPVPPDAWQKAITSTSPNSSPSIGQIIGAAIIDSLLVHNSRFDDRSTSAASSLSPEERDAQSRKRRGVVGFDVGLALEVAGLPADEAEALLWRLVDFTHPLGDGRQEIRWKVQRAAVGNPPRARLADWELAQLWYLPDASFDRAGFIRDRPLAAPPPVVGSRELGLVVAESRGRPLAIPISILPRHVIALGATGSGKSTLLLNLALAAIEADIGTTVIDPHGDLVADILCRIPRSAVGRIHVLRLADRAHPRGFNFLERRSPSDDQLVASEFVYLLEDLWPRFSGPKMQHYLRNALLTLLADEQPQTILELIRVLTDDAFRERFVRQLRDPMIRSFWETQWPGRGERERDTSIKAVLNKLGAFVTYDSIRAVVGQGISTTRPRDVMDRGEVLLVDLSGVGGDNATLFRGDARQPLLRRRGRPPGVAALRPSAASAAHRRGASVRDPCGREHLGRGPKVRPRSRPRVAVARWAGGAPQPIRPDERGIDRAARARLRGRPQPGPAVRPGDGGAADVPSGVRGRHADAWAGWPADGFRRDPGAAGAGRPGCSRGDHRCE